MAQQNQRSLKMDFLLGGLAASGAGLRILAIHDAICIGDYSIHFAETYVSCIIVTLSNPMEVIKTRLQLQGELQKSGIYLKSYKGFWHAFYVITKLEGLRGIQKGLSLAYPYTILMNGTRLGLYEYGKTFLAEVSGLKKTNVFVGMLSGAMSGVIGSLIANPFYIAKTRLQSFSPQLPVGYQHKYNGSLGALLSIYKEGGFSGLFNGTKAACIRIAVASPTQLVTYDFAKRNVLQLGVSDGLHVHVLSSIISGALLVIVLNPFDVVTIRLYNQKMENGKGTLYKGFADCFSKILKTEGFFGLYKGLVPHYARIAPHTIMLLVLLEQLRKLADRWQINW